MVFALTKLVETNFSLQAEAEAINWEAQVVAMFAMIVIESDVKACIEALPSPTNEVPWRISIVFADTLSWASHSLFHGFQMDS